MSIAARAAARIQRRICTFACIAAVVASVGQAAHAANESIVYRFMSGADGFEPAQLLVGNDGNFYGTSHNIPNTQGVAAGIVFRLTPSGLLTPLVTFSDNMLGRLAKGSDGNFYGMTINAGAGKPGILFKLTPAGAFTTLYTFGDADAQEFPILVEGSDGNWYGSAGIGGNVYGTLFRFNPTTHVLTTLHAFDGADGGDPTALIAGADGSIYGATQFGGSDNAGTVFKITPPGTFTTVRQLDDHTYLTGSSPVGLTQAADGNFYGVTQGGGATGWGTIFKMTPTGTLRVLAYFRTSVRPSPLMQAADGNFYGSLSYGGVNSVGTVYRMNAAGAMVKLYAFGSTAGDGTYPDGPLVEGVDGNLYGPTASGGGGTSYGTIYKIGDLAADSVAITPDSAESLLLTTQCVAASVFDRNNVARPYAPIAFQRTGANPGSASTSADGTGVATHCWSGANAGDDKLTATSGSIADVARIRWLPRSLNIVAKGYVEALPLQDQVTIHPAATLTDVVTGAPVAGRTVQFLAFGKYLCSGVTAANGKAECKALLKQNLNVVAGAGYSAIFQGDAAYRSNTADGSLACVGTVCGP